MILEKIHERLDLFKEYLSFVQIGYQYEPPLVFRGNEVIFNEWLFNKGRYDLVDFCDKIEGTSTMRLFDQLQKLLGVGADRQIKSNPYYWTEYTDGDISYKETDIKPGSPVTITLTPESYNGQRLDSKI